MSYTPQASHTILSLNDNMIVSQDADGFQENNEELFPLELFSADYMLARTMSLSETTNKPGSPIFCCQGGSDALTDICVSEPGLAVSTMHNLEISLRPDAFARTATPDRGHPAPTCLNDIHEPNVVGAIDNYFTA